MVRKKRHKHDQVYRVHEEKLAKNVPRQGEQQNGGVKGTSRKLPWRLRLIKHLEFNKDSRRNTQSQLRNPLISLKYFSGKRRKKRGKCRYAGHSQVPTWSSISGGGRR